MADGWDIIYVLLHNKQLLNEKHPPKLEYFV